MAADAVKDKVLMVFLFDPECQITCDKVRPAVRELKEQFAKSVSYVEIDASENAVKASKELADQNYKEQLRDFTHGLVTNLDVIQALSTLQDAVRAYDKVVYQTISSYILLQTSKGSIPSAF